MGTPAKADWRIAGEEVANCNCTWGCPCHFDALPTYGRCKAPIGLQIREDHFGNTRLDGARSARIFSWPGPTYEGNGGTWQLIIDEQATSEQRDAPTTLDSGEQGGVYFEIFAAVCRNVLETIFAPIGFESDWGRRQATLYIPSFGEARTEPIKNPVMGEEHRARTVLPYGFEYKEAEGGNTAYLRAQSDGKVAFEHESAYAQLNAFDWSNA